MAVSDEQIGKNLARLRGDMTQKELAAAMKARGCRWSQTTVWSVENGERPLRLAEAEDLRDILPSGWSLTWRDPDAAAVERSRRMYNLDKELRAVVRAYLEEQVQLRFAVEAEGVSPRVREMVSDWLKATPTMVVEEVAIEDDVQAEAEVQVYEKVRALHEQHSEAP